MQPDSQFEVFPEQHVYRLSLVKSLVDVLSPLIGCVFCTSLCLLFAGSLLFPPYMVGKILGGPFFLLVFAPLGYLFVVAVLGHLSIFEISI